MPNPKTVSDYYPNVGEYPVQTPLEIVGEILEQEEETDEPNEE